MEIAAVFQLMEQDLKRVEQQFEENLRSEVSLIPTIGRYILQSGGKRVRPLLLLLSARLCGYRGEHAVPLASIVEFIHTATLLHDDVVDNANLRRGQRAANTVWGNSASVLVGDFLFSKSFSLMVATGDIRVLKSMSDATTRLAEGEVLQLLKTCDVEISEEEYLEVVINKTAVLIAAACEMGALLGNAPAAGVEALYQFGMEVGIAFQLMDDCLDYIANAEEFGKAVGADLREGKITLPLIHTIRSCTDRERHAIRTVVEKDVLEEDELDLVMQLIRKYEGIEFTRREAERRIDSAISRLAILDEATERSALESVARYVVSRTR
ncbi:MAG: polyprenyl synthetase family protein [Deltaproteobacteria bacterium]|nr:polyprenyl synthetase family protein [Deltaproteobacteria bacterium]